MPYLIQTAWVDEDRGRSGWTTLWNLGSFETLAYADAKAIRMYDDECPYDGVRVVDAATGRPPVREPRFDEADAIIPF